MNRKIMTILFIGFFLLAGISSISADLINEKVSNTNILKDDIIPSIYPDIVFLIGTLIDSKENETHNNITIDKALYIEYSRVNGFLLFILAEHNFIFPKEFYTFRGILKNNFICGMFIWQRSY